MSDLINMPIPSDPVSAAEWSARSAASRRSIFGNYRAGEGPQAGPPAAPAVTRLAAAGQVTVDQAIARAFIYRFLAKAYEDPTVEGWETLLRLKEEFKRAAEMEFGAPEEGRAAEMEFGAPKEGRAAEMEFGAPKKETVAHMAETFVSKLAADGFENYVTCYLSAFGHAARGRCPLNEIEYGDIKADPLFQPHRLADLGAFYRAFGLDLAENADERHDHICLELEFMCVLSAKEAYALEHRLPGDELSICRHAQKKFLREHLGRWTPGFAHRLAAMAGDSGLGALAAFTGAFIAGECARLGVPLGSEDILLRPVDEKAESLCTACGTGAPRT